MLRKLLRKKRNQSTQGVVPNVDWLIVGLGNPGQRYANTRHNIGRMVADACIERLGHFSQTKGKTFEASFGQIGSAVVAVVTPTLYMNESGRAVAEAQRLFSVSSDRVVVILDEYNFPVGKVHVKLGGGSGGHNGTQSVIDKTESREFVRMRCGIDRNFGPGELVEYVLSPFAPEEHLAVEELVNASVVAIEHLVVTPFGTACSDINSGKLFV